MLAGLLVATALALSITGPAAAVPQAMSPRGMQVQQLEVAASPARSGLVMAGYRGQLRAARWQLLAKLGDRPLQRLDGSVFSPQIAVGADGTAIAAWVAGHSLRAAIAPPRRGFGRPKTLARAPRDIPSGSAGVVPGGIAVGRRGTGVIAWRHGDGPTAVVRVAFRRDAGFAAAQTLGDSDYAPTVARTPADAFVVAWQTRPRMPAPGVPPTLEGNPRVLLATAVSGASVFGAPTTLAGPPAFLSTPPTAFTGPGGAAVTWREQADRPVAILARAETTDTAALGPARSNDLQHDDPVSVATPSDGSAVAIWRLVHTSGARVVGSQVLAAHRPASGAFSAPQALSVASRFADPPAVAAVRGRTIAAWSERAPRGKARLRVRAHDGNAWNAPVTFARADAFAHVRMSATGRSAALAWVARSGHARGRAYLEDMSAFRR